MIASANCSVIIHDGSVRAVEFLSILVIGMLAVVLLTHIVQCIKKAQK